MSCTRKLITVFDSDEKDFTMCEATHKAAAVKTRTVVLSTA